MRRTAIYLLREFGGSEALPELTGLLNDNEQQVQREAVRAILRIGTESAYQVLEKALLTGTDQSREMIMQALTLVRDDRATPLFSYILNHLDHRGQLGSIYMRAIEALGTRSGIPEGVPALKSALYRGEWWAPRRTAALRAAAAQALARIGTPEALSCRPRGGGGVRQPRDPDRGAHPPGERAHGTIGRSPGNPHDDATPATGRRAPPALRGSAPLGTALFAEPSDHRRATSTCSPAAVQQLHEHAPPSSSASSVTRSSSTTCRSPKRIRSAASRGG